VELTYNNWQYSIGPVPGSQHNNAIKLGGKGWEIIKTVTREGRFSPRLFFYLRQLKLGRMTGCFFLQ
jgi:hypothetical protein